jgi:hypothetical protein
MDREGRGVTAPWSFVLRPLYFPPSGILPPMQPRDLVRKLGHTCPSYPLYTSSLTRPIIQTHPPILCAPKVRQHWTQAKARRCCGFHESLDPIVSIDMPVHSGSSNLKALRQRQGSYDLVAFNFILRELQWNCHDVDSVYIGPHPNRLPAESTGSLVARVESPSARANGYDTSSI